MLKKMLITLSILFFSTIANANSILGVNTNKVFNDKNPNEAFSVKTNQTFASFSHKVDVTLDQNKKVSTLFIKKEYMPHSNQSLTNAIYNFNLLSESLSRKYQSKYTVFNKNHKYFPDPILYVGKADTDEWYITLLMTQYQQNAHTVYTVELLYERKTTHFTKTSELKSEL